ncbi:type IX secretion system membrane protein PorP/SprF [Chitinophaga sp.]|uniref:PorP/SprF family type IX secretion system membrane protein n=1 Tax=Chitinophaga sp. TaxID=1869181 RepID=UPI0031DAFE9E
MKPYLISLAGILLVALSQSAMAQQDAQFSQYMFNGIYINPAYAGYREQLNISAFYRNQWSGLDGAPQTVSLAVDATANNERVGLALQLMNDRIGAQSNTMAYLNYAYRIPVGNRENGSTLALGIGAGVAQYRLDGSKLDPNDGADPLLLNQRRSLLMPDARAGIYYSNNRFYAGLSVDNIIVHYLEPKKDNEQFFPDKKMHAYLTAGGLIPLSENFLLKPSFMWKEDFAGPGSLDLNAFLLIAEKIWVGASYRTAFNVFKKDHLDANLRRPAAFVALAEIYVAQKLRIGYGYDIPLNRLGDYNYASHEISLGYFFTPRKARMLTPRYF